MDNHRGGTPVETTTRRPRKVAQGAWIWLAVFGMLASFIGVVQPATAQASFGDDGLSVTVSQDSIVQGSGDAFTFKVKDTNRSGMVFDSYYLYGFADGWTVYNGGTLLTPVVSDPLIYEISKADAQAGKISAKPPVGFEGTLDSVTFARVQVTNEPVEAPATSDAPAPSEEAAVSPEPSDSADDSAIQSGDDGTVNAEQPASDETATEEPSVAPVDENTDNIATGDQVTVTDISGAAVEPGSVDDIVANLAATNSSDTSTGKWGANWWWLHCKCCICKCCCCPLKVLKSTNQLTINKISNPVTGSSVDAGQVVTYTVTAKNPSLLLSLTSATITDDLSDVLDNAQLTGTPTATISGRATTAPVINGTTLTWNGSLGKLQTVTITYSVIVNTDVNPGANLVNHVIGYGVNSFKKNIVSNCQTGTEVGCTSTLTATGPQLPGLQVSKTSDPPTGSYVLAGRLVNYNLTATNTGNVTLNNVTLTDNLSDVLDNATITGSFSSTIDGVAQLGGVVLSGTTLTWNGALAPGQTVVVGYAVMVNEGTTYHDSLRNGVIGDTGTSTPSNCVTGQEEGCYSLLNPPMVNPSLRVAKVSDPVDGALVSPGQTITYTVTAYNPGISVLNPVNVTDNLSGILGSADFVQGSLMATIDGAPASPAASLLGSTVAWTGSLNPGSTITIQYKAVVHADVTSANVLTNAVVGSAEDPQFPGLPADSTCVTGLEQGCYSTLTGAATGLTVNKTSDPASGSIVGPGQTVTYTISASNSGDVDLNPVVINDSLSDILNASSLVADSLSATVAGTLVGAPQIDGGILSWQGAVPAGQTAVVTYQVVLNNDLDSVSLLKNKAIGYGFNPFSPNDRIDSNCVTGQEPGCSSSLTVGHPNLEVSKASDPANGSFYTSGQTITYTLTARNTGNIDLDSVTLTDDLTDVVDNAIFDFAFTAAMLDGAPSPIMPSIDQSATALTWNGPLAAGSTLTLTYVVTAAGGSVGQQIANHVVSSATVAYNPSLVVPTTCVTGEEDGCFSILTPYLPSMRVWKTSDQGSGIMHQGDIITFNVYGQNDGTVDLVTATVIDHLQAVLPYADLEPGPYVATINGQPAGTVSLDLDASTLTWDGALAAGETVQMVFQVKINAQVVSSDEMLNRATGSGEDSALARSIVPSNCMTGYEDGCFVSLHGADPVVTANSTTGISPADEPAINDANDSNELTQPANDNLPGALSDASFRLESMVDSASDEVVDPAPELVVNTVSTPSSGAMVSPSQTVSYIVTASNRGNVNLNRVAVIDNLSDVVDNGSIRPLSLSASMNGEAVHDPILTSSDTLAWVGDIPAGQTVTMSYQVAIDANLDPADTLQSTVTSTAMDPVDPDQVLMSNCVTGEEAGCNTEVTPRVSNLLVGLTSDSPSVDSVQQGDVITFTVTGQNAGNVDLYNVTLNDDLTGVVNNAHLAQVPTAGIIDGQESGEVTMSGNVLTWVGDLPVGKTVTVTYQAIVDAESVAADVLSNHVTGYGSDSQFALAHVPSNCTSGYEEGCFAMFGILRYYLRKLSVPDTSVRPDEVLTYRLRIVNNSSKGGDSGLPDVDLSPTITDDLSDILPFVDYIGNETATLSEWSRAIDGYAPAVATHLPTFDGTTLTWQGEIPAWNALVITFQVHVKETTPNGTMLNNEVVSSPIDTQSGLYYDFCNPSDLKIYNGQEIDSDDSHYSADLPDVNWCKTSIPVAAISLDMSKTSDPESGSTVAPGSPITYTLTAHNNGTTALTDVTVKDDLSDVLSDATMGSVSAKIGDTAAAAPTVTNKVLEWKGDLQGGQTVTVTYTVTVNQDVDAATVLTNSVTGEATDPNASDVPVPVTCKTGSEPGCSTELTTTAPKLDISKVSDPPTGSKVAPGATVTYTLTAKNSGNTNLEPVTLTDNLSDILDDAKLDQSSLSATIDGAAASAPIVGTDNKLTWTGALAEGKTVTVTYKVTINADLANADTLKNGVTGTGHVPNSDQPVDSTCVTGEEEGCSSTLVPDITKFIVTKTSDPESFVRPGDTITYTITGVNSGNQDLTPTVHDSLANVTNNATYNNDAIAKVDGQTVTAPSIANNELTWTGSVPKGQSVVITYSVTVKDGTASGTKIVNNVSTDIPGSCDPAVAVCATTVTVSNTGLQISKVSDPATGSSVKTGDVVTYTLTATNTGETQLTNVNLSDNLTPVLAHATINGTPTAVISDGSSAAAPQVENNILAWTGVLEGGATVTVTYKVTIGSLTAGELLTNKVTGSAVDPDNPNEPVPSTCVTGNETGCSSTLNPEIPSVEISKVSDPVSGTAVAPNQVVTYTLTAENTGNVDLAAVAVSDNLTGVLAYAEMNGTPTATINDNPTPLQPVTTDVGIAWIGPLAAGQTVKVTYQVKVNADAVSPATLMNKVIGGGSVIGGANGDVVTSNCSLGTEDGCFSRLPVGGSAFETTKVSDPTDVIYPGEDITFTVTSTNTGQVPGDPSLSDTLTGVATLNADSFSVTIDGAVQQTAPVVAADGKSWTWNGTVPAGKAVVITYTATVNEDAVPGDTVENCVVTAGSDEAVCSGILPEPGLTVNKTSVPPTGSNVGAGEVVSYTLTAKNQDPTETYTDVVLSDNLSSVLAHATLNENSYPVMVGTNQIGTATLSNDNVLSWTGSLAAQATATLTYSVTIDPDVDLATVLKNGVTGTAPSPRTDHPGNVPSTCVTGNEPGCFSTVTVGGTTFVTTKTADPSDVVYPGEKITYTVTSQNTGEVPGDPALEDDITNVVNNATLDTATLIAKIDGVVQNAPILAADGKSWTWNGTVDAGKSVVVTYQVTVNANAQPGTTFENCVTQGANAPVCVKNPPVVPGLQMGKVSVPATGEKVTAGDTVTYTLTAKNVHPSQTYPSVTLSDDLSGVLAHATLNATSFPVMVGTQNVGTATLSNANVLSWTGSLDAGATATITYSVTVKSDVESGQVLTNAVTGSAPNPDTTHPGNVPSSCVTGKEPGCFSTVTVGGFDWTKVPDVDVAHPGDEITYTISGTNTSGVAVNKTITDDMTDAAKYATFVEGSVETNINPLPSVSDNVLTWTGSVPDGQTLTITYKMKVNADAVPGTTIINKVGVDKLPPDDCTTDPTIEGCVKVIVGDLQMKKTSVPASGSKVTSGDTVTYTLTATNVAPVKDGATINPVILTDNLADVLDNATLDMSSLTASISDGSTAAAPTLTGTTLTWRGTLLPQATVTVTYKVTVNAGVATGEVLTNRVTGSGTNPANPDVPIIPTCQTGEEPDCSSTVTVGGFNWTKTPSVEIAYPGDEITYTISGTNTSGVDVNKTITDDMSDAAKYATFVEGSVETNINPLPSVSNNVLTWTGSVPNGQTLTITYKMKVNADAVPGTTIINKVGVDEQPPIDCTTVPTPPGCVKVTVGDLAMEKTSVPASGSKVTANQVISYTLTATNVGDAENGVTFDPVTVSDDLANVLNHAAFVDGSLVTKVNGTVVTSGAATFTDGVVSWTGSLAPLAKVEVTYQVKVNSDVVTGQVLTNAVTGSGLKDNNPEEPIVPTCKTGEEPGCSSTLTVGGFDTTKTANVSLANPGDVITYTITGVNTSGVAVNKVVVDDMTDALLNAEFVEGSASAKIGSETVTAPTRTGSTLTWTGSVPDGQTLTITYQMKVHDDATPGTTLTNSVGVGEQGGPNPPPQPNCDSIPKPPECVEVTVPGLTISKTSVPPTGTKVTADQVISYTLTAINQNPEQPYTVTLSDNLADVLTHATLNAGPYPVKVGDQQVGTATLSNDNVLSWTGSLPSKATATLTYQVTVKSDVTAGQVLTNAVTGSAPNPDKPGENVTSTCVTGDEPGCSSTLTVGTAAFTFNKTASVSKAYPGDVIHYTITGTSSGDVDIPASAKVVDDLSEVLPYATFDSASLTAKIDGTDVTTMPVLGSDNVLTWTGPVAVGKVLTITYDMTVKDDVAPGTTLHNAVGAVGPVVDPCAQTPKPPQCVADVFVPGLNTSKVSDPVSGTSVVAGQTVSYTLTATNLDQDAAYDGVVLSDDLTNVLNHATLVPGSLTTKINGTAVQPGAAISDQNVLSWTGSLPAKATIVVNYQVIVNSDVVGGQVLRNGVTSTAPIPGKPGKDVPTTCIVGTNDPRCSSELPIKDTTITLTKTSSPSTFVDPGAVITYTLTGTNNGDVDAIKTLTDDLTDVLKNATYVTGSATASVNGATQTPPAVAGTSLTWTGTVPAGQTLTITYQMKVNDNAVPGTTLTNGVTTTNPGQPPVTPDCTVTPKPAWCNTVTVDGLKVGKVSNPESGSAMLLEPGTTITYTLTAQNIGDTLYYPVILTDRLSSSTTIVASSLNAKIDGVDVPAPTVSNGTLTWNGTLAAGKSVIVTYAVTVNATDVPQGGEIRNAVIGSAQDPTDPNRQIKSTCVTGLEVGCYSSLHATGNNPEAQIELAKTSNPSGVVHAGDTITYTVTATNVGDFDHTTTVTDHLDQVLSNATFVANSATAKIGTATQDAPVFSVTDKTLTWTGNIPHGLIATITYQVKVNADAPTGTVLRNEVTSDSNDTCDPTVNPDCRHDVTVDNPGLQISKTSDPPTGSKVYSGQTVTYTLKAVNKGLDDLNVTLSDNLAGVLAYAQMAQGPFTAMIDGQAAGNAAVSSRVLTWAGSVPAGKTVTLAYSVIMNNDLSTATGTLKNDVTGTGSNPKNPGEEIPSTCVTGDEPGCSSTLTPEDIAFLVTKVSNPPTGSIVSPTQPVTYTISGTNTSSGPINATLTDDLSGVLSNAAIVFGTAKTTIDGQPASDPVSSSANKTLTWNGTLNAGQKAVMTYTVVVNQNATVASTVRNSVIGTAKNPNNPDENLPTSCTTGSELNCSTTVTVGDARIHVTKASDPANGNRVNSGDTVTYTLTAQTANLALNPVTLTDDLSDVLDNADLVEGSLSATIDGQEQAAPTISAANVLTWSGPVAATKMVKVTFAVVVKADQPVTASLYNTVIGGGTDTNNPNTPAKSDCLLGTEAGCYTNLPIGEAPSPRLSISKVSDPVTGSVVRAGQVITYTLTGANTGNRDLNPVTLTDDLTNVVSHATLVPGSLKATIGGDQVTAPTITNNVLTWSGAVARGKSVVVTYQFTVNQDITVNDTLTNGVTGKATAPDLPPGTDVPSTCEPNCSSTLTGGEGYLTIAKTSDPVSGSTARPGQTITYTLTASNTGNAPIDDVVMTDNLSGVLGAATLVPGSLTVTSAGTAQAPALMGSSIVWQGSLTAGQSVTVSYQVVVNSTVTVTDKIVNKVTGVGTNPDINPKNPDKKTPSTCVTGDEPGCSSVIIPEISKLTITKAANVPSATAGQTITYTVTAVNSGTVDLNPVQVTDNLSDVLRFATVNGAPTATINGAAAAAPVLSNSILTWNGALTAGQKLVMTYKVTVNTNVTTTATVYNHVQGTGVNPKNPGGPNPSTCVTGQEPGCSVPVIVGPIKIATGGAASHSWTPMETLPLMGVLSGLLLAYFSTRRPVTIKH